MNVLRILHVIGAMNCGGAETLIMNLFRNIDRTHVVFDFLVHTDEEGYYDKEIKSLGGKIYSINRFTGKNVIAYYNEVKSFFYNHREYKIVHGHIGSCASLYLMAAKKNGCITIAHSHSTGEGIKNIHDLAYKFFSYPTRYIADYFFGCSTEAGRKRYGSKVVNSSCYQNFQNAIDLSRFDYLPEVGSNIKKQLNIQGKNIIGTVGRITDAKNPLFIVEILEKFDLENNNSVFLWVGHGDMFDVVAKLIENKQLNKSIILVGQKNNVEDYLMAMDIFIFPSKYEGLPTSVIEAQATGLTCILSDRITKEVEVTDLVKWLPINESIDVWVNCLKNISTADRKARKKEIINAGYDIYTNSKNLVSFYDKILLNRGIK